MSHSQKNEEEHILRLVGDRVGRFLDIGAYDGETYSNTLALVERGWEGILVEPGLEAFQALLKRHGGNPKLTLVHGVIGPRRISPFWNNPRSFSTTKSSNRDKFMAEGFSEQFWVPSIPFEDILDQFPGPIDVLSIDTEGTSTGLFRNFPLLLVDPRVICVEHDAWWNGVWDMERFDSLKNFAKGRGYYLAHSNEENAIFAKD